jgi:hypothetical protein
MKNTRLLASSKHRMTNTDSLAFMLPEEEFFSVV